MSKASIDRSGKLLRGFWRGDRLADAEVADALELVAAFRQAHAYPLTLVAVGLRQFVERDASTGVVGQRLKRMDRILQKLVRFPSMRLARMQDIGGCRAVFAGPDEVEMVAARVRRNWEVTAEKDRRRDSPGPMGYRALHLVVARAAPASGEQRSIEVQLRTRGQHLWAEEVERVAWLNRLPLKDAQGPEELIAYFEVAADIIEQRERGPANEVDSDLIERHALLRRRVLGYLQVRS